MTEENKFKPKGSIDLYRDAIGKVTLYDASHANESEEQRIWTVTSIASLAYGNEEALNPEALYQRMQSIKHESLWEWVVDTYPHATLATSMRNDPTHYDRRYSNADNIKEHPDHLATFRIKVPLFVARQFMRHRSFAYLEMSRRYTKGAKVPFEFWFPESYPYSKDVQADSYRQSYEKALADGFDNQIASRFLPQTTYTEFYMMGSVEGLKNFFKLRLDSHAQAEIQEVAIAMLTLLKEHQPVLYSKVKGA